jgi:hypothetical protein
MSESVTHLKYTDQAGIPHIATNIDGVVTDDKIWHWEILPGLKGRAGYNEIFFLVPGILSVSNPEYATYLAQGCRWGLDVEQWLLHPGYYGDLWRAARNKAGGVDLCPECDGTGNWLGTSYQKCSPCKGTGGVGGTGVTGR